MLANSQQSFEEHEITVALYNWSLPWMTYLAVTGGALAAVYFWLGVRNLFLELHPVEAMWSFPICAGHLFASYCLFRYHRASESFVAEETDALLLGSLKWLGGFWFSLTIASLFLLLRVFSKLIPSPIDGIEGGQLPFVLTGLLVSLLLFIHLKEERKSSPSDTYSSSLKAYGVRNLKNLKLTFNIFYFLSFFMALKGISDPFGEPIEIRVMSVCLSLAFGFAGFSLNRYWKRVKGIVRNPVRPFFQMCLNHLNIFWIALGALFILQLIFSLLGWF